MTSESHSAAPPMSSRSGASTTAEVEATARDYIEGWYAGDVRRMDRSLHGELVKRTRTEHDPDALRQVSRSRMVELTAEGGGDGPAADIQIWVDDVSHEIASVRVVSPDYVDYLHLVSTSHGWRIANVLFRNRS